MKIEKINLEGKKSSVEVKDSIFSSKINEKLISSVIYKTNANYKGRSSKTKQKNEIIGSTSKIYAQKGTGNARHASRKAPIFVGGGIAHGPKGRNSYKTRKLNKNEKRQSISSILSKKLKLKEVIVFDDFSKEIKKTKEMDKIFNSFSQVLNKFDNEHGYANSRARLRMATLYQVAAANDGIVVGTGNKVEDFGVGFYTKYGDGGVDISPIADCNKTEVWELGKELGILKEIIDAPPTDGLWDDGRTDEGQLGLSYKELEEAMENENSINREKYNSIRRTNLHKMEPIPVCKIPN